MGTLCMSLECENIVERHGFNFGTGFCKECQKKYDIATLNQLNDKL